MSEVFVGRQPLLDRSGVTIGYELLYRSTASADTAMVVDGDAATARVLLNATTEIGLDRLVGDTLAFINLTRSYLTDPSILECLPADRVVLEVLEDIESCDEVIDGLKHLRGLGYRIALDDFDANGPTAPLLDYASIIKYDLSQIDGDELRQRIAVDHDAGRTVVVERVETQDEYAEVAAAGADWFQGYFFARPATVTATAIAPNTLSLVQLLAHINRPEATMNDIVDVLRHDVAMSVKVLRYVNTAAFSRLTSIDSIQTAAVLVGQDRLRSWTALALLSSIDNKPTELINIALTRAKFCELVAHQRRLTDADAFYTLGMLSLLDTMTDTPMSTITAQIAIGDNIRSALIGDDSELNAVLRDALDIEDAMANKTLDTIDADTLRTYHAAMTWAIEIVTTTSR